jgi:hypothetical protein
MSNRRKPGRPWLSIPRRPNVLEQGRAELREKRLAEGPGEMNYRKWLNWLGVS